MSLIPFLFDECDSFKSSRILDQHFGMELDPSDIFTPVAIPSSRCFMRPWFANRGTSSSMSVEVDKFQINLDVQQFAPGEISVKVGDDSIMIEGKHEEKRDEHGYISRHFVRRYVLPKEHDIEKVESKLSSDGVLTVTAPRINAEKVEHRNIPITQTGTPLKIVEIKPETQSKL